MTDKPKAPDTAVTHPVKPPPRPLKVAQVLDEYSVVINRGRAGGLVPGQRVLIYVIGEEVLDPDTKESLGKLEMVKGTGKVRHLQEQMATVTSDMRAPSGRTIRKPVGGMAALSLALGARVEEEEILPSTRLPFEDVQVGDLVRVI